MSELNLFDVPTPPAAPLDPADAVPLTIPPRWEVRQAATPVPAEELLQVLGACAATREHRSSLRRTAAGVLARATETGHLVPAQPGDAGALAVLEERRLVGWTPAPWRRPCGELRFGWMPMLTPQACAILRGAVPAAELDRTAAQVPTPAVVVDSGAAELARVTARAAARGYRRVAGNASSRTSLASRTLDQVVVHRCDPHGRLLPLLDGDERLLEQLAAGGMLSWIPDRWLDAVGETWWGWRPSMTPAGWAALAPWARLVVEGPAPRSAGAAVSTHRPHAGAGHQDDQAGPPGSAARARL